jgi:hypothetical protein
MVGVTEISAVVAAAGVLVGVAYYVLDMRHQSKVRQTDLTVRLFSQVCSKEFMEAIHKLLSAEYRDYSDFVKRYGGVLSEDPVSVAYSMVCMYHEGMGVLLKRKLVDVDLIRDLFNVTSWWEKLKPIIYGVREERHQPSYYEWFEYLVNEIKKREQKLRAGVKSG